MRERTLILKKEPGTELTADQLAGVAAAGDHPPTAVVCHSWFDCTLNPCNPFGLSQYVC